MKNILTVDELISINEKMLGRGAPITEDGIGYNKADYGACSNYYYGLSRAQIADLAKRLIKYSDTQLNINREVIKDTAEYYKNILKNGDNRKYGVSIDVGKDRTVIGFCYNDVFIKVIRHQIGRKFDNIKKEWSVPNRYLISTLNALKNAGADVDNAIKFATEKLKRFD